MRNLHGVKRPFKAPVVSKRDYIRLNLLTGAAVGMRLKNYCLSLLLLLLLLAVQVCEPVCVEVPSETEAVLGNSIKLTCISCMRREEVTATTEVTWSFIRPNGPKNESVVIFQYKGQPMQQRGPWQGRLVWNGSKDMQDVSISITNVTMNDTGNYTCFVERNFQFEYYKHKQEDTKVINLTVQEEASEDTTALYSQIMMYVLLVFLTFWLLVEMIYCYRKISKSDEQVQDSATDYLAIPSEHKDNTAAPVVE